jgi:hypothetical protein
MTQTRAKFTCTEVSKRTGWGGNKFLYAAKFSAVTGNSDENKTFFAATPSGSIEVSTVKEDHFEVGKTYFVDFTVAE